MTKEESATKSTFQFHDHNSISQSPSTDFSSSTITDQSDSTSVGSTNTSELLLADKAVGRNDDSCLNEGNLGRFCVSKPHKGNDVRWDAIQSVQARNGGLGLGHFRLLKKLGFGDIGSVYLAELRGFKGCLFAMKVMDRAMLVSRKKVARAKTEREILSLLDHPFLPTLYSHFESEKFSCLLMEFCCGGDLHLLRQRQPCKHFSNRDRRSMNLVLFLCRFYASEVLLALEYLHMMGVVYRDLKPENVLVREDGHIMLSDFDLSLRCCVSPTLVTTSSIHAQACTASSYCIDPSCKLSPSCFIQPSCFKPRALFDSKSTTKVRKERTATTQNPHSLPVLVAEPSGARSMSFVGTHEYLAPEIIRGDGHGSSVDWWTFGVFLHELLYGKTPFKGNGNRETLFNVVGQQLKFPDGSSTMISFAAKDLIQKLLAKDPKKRLGFKRGATEIKQHPFFEGVNWALIRSNTPPQIPKSVDNDEVKSSTGTYLDFNFF